MNRNFIGAFICWLTVSLAIGTATEPLWGVWVACVLVGVVYGAGLLVYGKDGFNPTRWDI
jgi:hypothetical protein